MEDKKPELKVFELKWKTRGDREWMCAYTNIQAIKEYCSITSTDLSDMDDVDEIIEIPKEKWGEYNINNSEYDEKDPDDWKEKTFEEYMKTQTTPDIIAGTMYE
jgi:hypothetical protein